MLYLIILTSLWNLIIIINKRRKILKINTIKSFNLGSSHSLCAFENNLKDNINLAENSQTFYYDYKILNHYFKRIEENTTCFITISYFSFNSKEYWLETDLIKYYKLLKISDFKGKIKFQCIIYKYFPILWSILKKFIKEKEYDKNKRILGHIKKLEDGKNVEYNMHLLENIILKCKEKNMNVILLTTPFTRKYNSFFSEKLLKEKFYININKVIKKHNILYLDLSHDYENFDKEEYFRDEDHLSLEGSKRFIEVIKEYKNVNKNKNREIYKK